ncbi:MAG: NTP transferase domain-containing protein [Muribaculaceae bacterium]|nr:NTP transferase domain-containing protein [Muribaculaceae bacterium]
MKTMILCAGLGTRLKPWTERHPKALVPVGGIPMLRRVIDRLSAQGFDEVTVNVHHFADQIIDFLDGHDLPINNVSVSDESDKLLDTGGGILHAEKYLAGDSRPFLVHNVDILSNADLEALYKTHEDSASHVTLLVSDRKTDRKLVFDRNYSLKGWINLTTGQTRPASLEILPGDHVLAFSGIYVMSPGVFDIMKENGFKDAFPIMDLFLSGISGLRITGDRQDNLEIIDIGKPDTLHRANLSLQ